MDIEKLFEAAIQNEKEEDKKRLTQTFANSILIHIKTILSTLNKNFSAEKFLKVVKSDSKKRSLKILNIFNWAIVALNGDYEYLIKNKILKN